MPHIAIDNYHLLIFQLLLEGRGNYKYFFHDKEWAAKMSVTFQTPVKFMIPEYLHCMREKKLSIKDGIKERIGEIGKNYESKYRNKSI